MKHQLLTSKIILRMAIVLFFVAMFNFGFSHFFLSEKLSLYMEEGLWEKKNLIVENVDGIVRTQMDEGQTYNHLEKSLTTMMNNQEEITQLAVFNLNEEKRAEPIILKENKLNVNFNQDLVGKAIQENKEIVEDERIDGHSVRTFYVPLNNQELIVIQANLEQQNTLEMSIIFADIFGTLSAFLLILIFLYSIFRRQLKPLGEIEAYLGAVADGQLSKRLQVDQHKEFSWLAKSINVWLNKSKSLF